MNELVLKLYEIITTFPGYSCLLGTSFVSLGLIGNVLKKEISKKHSLIKENRFAYLKIISETPPITKKENQGILPPEEIKEYIEEFITKLKNKLSKKQFEAIITNLANLKYKTEFNDSIKQKINNTAGYYSSKDHLISVNKFSIPKNDTYKAFKQVLFHELLHASVEHIKDEDKYFSGFFQADYADYIGIGLDEGYTDYLAKKFVDSKENIISVGYPYEIAIVAFIEFIVGEEKMCELYFNSDLKGLCDELSKYEKLYNVKRFIGNLDTITMLKRINNIPTDKDTTKLETEIETFLLNLYKNKMNKCYDIRNNPDSLKSYLEEEKKFITIYSNITKYKNKYIDKIDVKKHKSLTKFKKGFISNTLIIITTFIISILLAILILNTIPH